jgi:hypothetical protein
MINFHPLVSTMTQNEIVVRVQYAKQINSVVRLGNGAVGIPLA